MNLLGSQAFNTSLSQLSDPFKAANLESVMLRWTRLTEGSPPWIYAKVEFKNGSTKGEHKIEADSMDALIVKVKSFLESLPK